MLRKGGPEQTRCRGVPMSGVPYLQLLIQLPEALLQMLLSGAGLAQGILIALCLFQRLGHSCLHERHSRSC